LGDLRVVDEVWITENLTKWKFMMKNRLLLNLLSLGAALVFLSGCSTFTPPKEQPVIEDKIGENFGTLAVTAERRIIIFGRDKSKKDEKLVCAEPSPDVAESLVSSLKAVAQASVNKGDAETKAGLEISKSLATAISSVFTRSQGVQFFRDNMYALCQAHLNGVVNPKQFNEMYLQITKYSYELIAKELPSADTKRAETAATRSEQARDAATLSAASSKTLSEAAKTSADAAALSATEAKKK
jgi:hypothetical protein